MTSDTAVGIHDAVRKLYERYPYPRYPLLARIRYTEGYLGNPLLAARLAEAITGKRSPLTSGGPESSLLVAGAGEALPYVLRHLTPRDLRLVSVDLSSSSLRRAAFRLTLTRGTCEWHVADLDDFLVETQQSFAHVDAYGVLHHMANPSRTLTGLATHLSPGGTLRVMVYNRRARRWIYDLARALQLIGLDPYQADDLGKARQWLDTLRRHVPALGEKLGFLGPRTLAEPARLVDTFFHARDAQLDPSQWFASFRAAELEPFALVDRYAELDDLPNPLWRMPTADELELRAGDLRYENNLEVYLRRLGPSSGHETPNHSQVTPSVARRALARRLKYARGPRLWFTFDETKKLGGSLRGKLWQRHVAHVTGTGDGSLDDLTRYLPILALRRLARIGAVLPGQIGDVGLRRALAEPLTTTAVEPPDRQKPVDLSATPVIDATRRLLASKGRSSERVLERVLERTDRAQRP